LYYFILHDCERSVKCCNYGSYFMIMLIKQNKWLQSSIILSKGGNNGTGTYTNSVCKLLFIQIQKDNEMLVPCNTTTQQQVKILGVAQGGVYKWHGGTGFLYRKSPPFARNYHHTLRKCWQNACVFRYAIPITSSMIYRSLDKKHQIQRFTV
jgi:hypothetical protein